jgi:L-lactate transport
MWQQNYTPVGGSLILSAVVAAMPIFVMLFLLGVLRKPAWVAALAGLGTAGLLALLVYRMPAKTMVASAGYGAAFGLFPIAWILFWAIMLHRLTVERGNFDLLKDSIGGLTPDRRLQALLIAFVFGALLEGAAGFGAPVAVAAAMLAGLGFPRFYAAGICLLANTAPVAFGSIGIPVVTLAGVTGLPVRVLSAWVGRICAPVSLVIPAYLVLVMGGVPALKGVLPAVVVCGAAFATTQWLVSNLLGPQLTDILSAFAAMGAIVTLLKFWQPKDGYVWAGEAGPAGGSPTGTTESYFARSPHSLARAVASVPSGGSPDGTGESPVPPIFRTRSKILLAWMPYLLLVLFVFLWGLNAVKAPLDRLTVRFAWPGLDNVVQRIPPVVARPSGYPAVFALNWMSASGTACLLAVLLTALLLGVTPRQFVKVLGTASRQLALSILTIAAVLALAFLMNYCGATATLGLAFAATGRLFPFFSALLGWAGVFLVGSDTSANALFGNLQVVTAGRLGLDPLLMAASNSSGGVMGKMISLSSIAVAAAATGLPTSDEAKLFRFTLKHSMILAVAIGLVVAFYSWLTTAVYW